jgi:hypothetical protein
MRGTIKLDCSDMQFKGIKGTASLRGHVDNGVIFATIFWATVDGAVKSLKVCRTGRIP